MSEEADSERIQDAGVERLQVSLGGRQASTDGTSVRHDDLSGARQTNRLRAAGLLDQSLPDHFFERRDLLADRRLRVPQPLGRAMKGPFGRNRLERQEVPQLHADPT